MSTETIDFKVGEVVAILDHTGHPFWFRRIAKIEDGRITLHKESSTFNSKGLRHEYDADQPNAFMYPFRITKMTDDLLLRWYLSRGLRAFGMYAHNAYLKANEAYRETDKAVSDQNIAEIQEHFQKASEVLEKSIMLWTRLKDLKKTV